MEAPRHVVTPADALESMETLKRAQDTMVMMAKESVARPTGTFSHYSLAPSPAPSIQNSPAASRSTHRPNLTWPDGREELRETNHDVQSKSPLSILRGGGGGTGSRNEALTAQPPVSPSGLSSTLLPMPPNAAVMTSGVSIVL